MGTVAQERLRLVESRSKDQRKKEYSVAVRVADLGKGVKELVEGIADTHPMGIVVTDELLKNKKLPREVKKFFRLELKRHPSYTIRALASRTIEDTAPVLIISLGKEGDKFGNRPSRVSLSLTADSSSATVHAWTAIGVNKQCVFLGLHIQGNYTDPSKQDKHFFSIAEPMLLLAKQAYLKAIVKEAGPRSVRDSGGVSGG